MADQTFCTDSDLHSAVMPVKLDGAFDSHPCSSRQSSSLEVAPRNNISYGSASSIFRSFQSLTPTRPTQDEATALWEIMPTSSLINNQLLDTSSHSNSNVGKRPQKSKQTFPIVSPIGSPPNESMLYSIPKIKNGPPYESTLPIKSTTYSLVKHSVKAYPLVPRPEAFDDSFDTNQDVISKCIHYGLGPHLGILPESIIYSIFGYIDYIERHPTLMLVSRGMTCMLARPEFLLEVKHAQRITCSAMSLLSRAFDDHSSNSSNELLLVVGGKCPIKADDANQRLTGRFAIDSGVHRRMMMQSNEHKGILGYDSKRCKWLRFGGDPMKPFKRDAVSSRYSNLHLQRTSLHPLSPVNIIDSKPIYVGHPIYSIMFFGGTHYETGRPSNRVIAFSFLTAKWEHWPDMIRPRRGEDIIVARVEPQEIEESSSDKRSIQANDSIVLIGCDLEFCDCYRCNPPTNDDSDESAEDVDMINNFMDSDMVPFPTQGVSTNLISSQRRDYSADAIGKCEVLDLTTRTWTQRESKAPSCPPDDGGIAVLGGRWVFLPGTCPPPPSTETCQQSGGPPSDHAGEMVTPLSQSASSSQSDFTQQNSDHIKDGGCSSLTNNMEIEARADDVEEMNTSFGKLFRSLHYRPGLVYDFLLDKWNTLPSRPYVTTSSPTTYAYQNRVLVLGGYRSSSENALSCYRHREEDAILDYEDHLDYSWWYAPNSLNGQFEANKEGTESNTNHNGMWTFGGGSSRIGHRQDFASSSDMAAAVAAATAMQLSSSCPDSHLDSVHNSSSTVIGNPFPFGAPVSVRGATMTTYQGRLTMLGGLSTFSRTFYDTERKTIWQFYPEACDWKRATVTLPAPALLDGYSFSLHI